MSVPDAPESEVAVVDVLPAARIADNVVDSPRGPALYIRGQGPMSVEGNRFQAVDVLGDFGDETFGTADQYVGTVFLYNTGFPAYLAAYLAGAGVPGLGGGMPTALAGSPVLMGLTAGGQTQFRGNQARLDLARRQSDIALANVLVVSLDDTVIAGNQTEGLLLGPTRTSAAASPGDLLFADLLNLALTTRQSHNGLMSTPILTMFSIVSRGVFNHCVDNQATSCISAIGTSPQSVVRDNAVIFPHPAFCPRG
jgi:hypothetical protein